MLNQHEFGEKLRRHRKSIGMTQEEAAEKIGVSAQAVSKWEAGECLPDCFNLKAICDIYNLSADVLLETEFDSDIDKVADKIEQLGTEFIWASAGCDRYRENMHCELGDDLWKMWKGLYFAEVGDRKMQEDDKRRGNTRICGSYGMKIWDDDGIACVIKASLIKNLDVADAVSSEIISALASEDGQKLIISLSCTEPVSKEDIAEATGIEAHRLNSLLLMFLENGVIEFVSDSRISGVRGYKISGHYGIAAYMVLAAMYILEKKCFTVSEYLRSFDE